MTFDSVGPVRHKLGTVDENFNVEFTSGPNITVTGTRKDITINDVIAVEGARIPAATEGRTFKVAFILLQQAGSSINQTEVTKLDNIRKGFVTWFNDQTGSRLTLDTKLAATGITAYTLPDNGGLFLVDVGHRVQYHYRLRQNPAGHRPHGAGRVGDLWIHRWRSTRFRSRRSGLAPDPERKDLRRSRRSGQHRVGHCESEQRSRDNNIQLYRFDGDRFRKRDDHDYRGRPDCEVPEPGPRSTVAITSTGRSRSIRTFRFLWLRCAV